MPEEDNKIIIRNLIILVLIISAIVAIVLFRKKIFPDFSLKNNLVSKPNSSSVSVTPNNSGVPSSQANNSVQPNNHVSENISPNEQVWVDDAEPTPTVVEQTYVLEENQWKTYRDEWGIMSISLPPLWEIQGGRIGVSSSELTDFVYDRSNFTLDQSGDGYSAADVFPNFNKTSSIDQLIGNRDVSNIIDFLKIEDFSMPNYSAKQIFYKNSFDRKIFVWDPKSHYSVIFNIWSDRDSFTSEVLEIVKTFKFSENCESIVDPVIKTL